MNKRPHPTVLLYNLFLPQKKRQKEGEIITVFYCENLFKMFPYQDFHPAAGVCSLALLPALLSDHVQLG
jgi:hypothetical protein